MRQELDVLLCERYPHIFANRHQSLRVSDMTFGFSCQDGWFALIDALCERLQFWTNYNHAPQVVAAQVKEKFGKLCFYVESADEAQHGMIVMAEAMSTHICEQCGYPGQLLVLGKGWHRTRCPQHTLEDAMPR